jgi:hypothetical protein
MSLDSQAAELELFFLRAVLPEEIEVAREPVILTGPREAVREDNVERQLNFGEAIKYLVAQPKPIRCRGRLSRGRFSLDTSSATVEQLQFHNWALSVPSPKLWERAGASSTDLLQVKSGKEATVVSFEAFEIWQRDYVRSGSTVIMGPSAIQEADSDSPKWQVGVGYAGPPAKSYSLHEDERVLCDRCRQQLAVAAFRDHSTMPVQTVLLCGDCLRAEAGRELGRAMGIEEKLSDEQAHQLIDSSFRSFQDDLRGHREDAHE